MKITVIPLPDDMPRMESGPIQFGDDWPGFFLRGDDAFRLYLLTREGARALQKIGDVVDSEQLNSWAKQLVSGLKGNLEEHDVNSE